MASPPSGVLLFGPPPEAPPSAGSASSPSGLRFANVSLSFLSRLPARQTLGFEPEVCRSVHPEDPGGGVCLPAGACRLLALLQGRVPGLVSAPPQVMSPHISGLLFISAVLRFSCCSWASSRSPGVCSLSAVNTHTHRSKVGLQPPPSRRRAVTPIDPRRLIAAAAAP